MHRTYTSVRVLPFSVEHACRTRFQCPKRELLAMHPLSLEEATRDRQICSLEKKVHRMNPDTQRDPRCPVFNFRGFQTERHIMRDF